MEDRAVEQRGSLGPHRAPAARVRNRRGRKRRATRQTSSPCTERSTAAARRLCRRTTTPRSARERQQQRPIQNRPERVYVRLEGLQEDQLRKHGKGKHGDTNDLSRKIFVVEKDHRHDFHDDINNSARHLKAGVERSEAQITCGERSSLPNT